MTLNCFFFRNRWWSLQINKAFKCTFFIFIFAKIYIYELSGPYFITQSLGFDGAGVSVFDSKSKNSWFKPHQHLMNWAILMSPNRTKHCLWIYIYIWKILSLSELCFLGSHTTKHYVMKGPDFTHLVLELPFSFTSKLIFP